MEKIDLICGNKSEACRIIGFGEETYATIDRINDLGYEDVLATKAIGGTEYVPGEDNKIAIFLMADRSGDACSTAKKFSQMGVLTIVISSDQGLVEKDCMTRCVVETVEQMYDVVKALLDSFCLQCYIGYDFKDLMTLLSLAESIRVITSDGHSAKEAVSGLMQKMSCINLNVVGDAAVHLYFNSKSRDLIRTDDVNDAMNNLVKALCAADVQLCFSIGYDDAMPSDRLRIAAILSEKKNIGQ